MASISSHVLDAVHGCSAVGVKVTCSRIAGSERQTIFEVQTDSEGRINEIASIPADDNAEYELNFATADYFERRGVGQNQQQIMRCVVVRITMPDPDRRYHIPVIVSPHSQSMWWSA